MTRGTDRFARAPHPAPRPSIALALALLLLWVPATIRLSQPLVPAHAIGALSKVSKSAEVPHDPIAPVPFVVASRTLVPAAVRSIHLDASDTPRLIDHARDATGLRAPPARTL